MTMKHDKGLLKAAQLKKFRCWLDASGFETRDGKGDFQVLQVKVSPKQWAVINSSASGVLSTHPELRSLINHFNRGVPPTVAPSAPSAPAPKRDTFLDDLRDDFAMAAMQGIVSNDAAMGRLRETACFQLISEGALLATGAYELAEAMLEERAKRMGSA